MKPNRNPDIKVEYGKHAKPFGKRKFHKKVRRIVKEKLRKEDI